MRMMRCPHQRTPSPAETVLQLSTSIWSAQALIAAASLNVADLLANGPKTPDALAQETGTLARPLYRVLHALAALGIFAEQTDGTFVNTPP
jgi:hypothetical protein